MTVTVIAGDALSRLRELPTERVHCIVTSPPYWRQRDYGHPEQIGIEDTPEAYVERLVGVFREARRVLRADGTLWLNLGDKWASGGYGGGGSFMVERGDAWGRKPPPCYKDKDLVGVPWMLAFALRADGWWLRSANIWAKPNGMPDSATDRPGTAHEYVFQLSKSARYYYGYDDVRVPLAPTSVDRLAQRLDEQLGSTRANAGGKTNGPMKAVRPRDKQRGHSRRHAGFNDRWDGMMKEEQQARGRALRSVWWVAPAQTTGGHYAVMPDQLAALMILAGCPKGGTVLDPFAGVGTTGLVADRLGRDAILVELTLDYAAAARARILTDAPMFAEVV